MQDKVRVVSGQTSGGSGPKKVTSVQLWADARSVGDSHPSCFIMFCLCLQYEQQTYTYSLVW